MFDGRMFVGQMFIGQMFFHQKNLNKTIQLMFWLYN